LATDTETAAAISSHATAANGHVGRGTTANRPGSPAVGDLYFDTTLDKLIQYTSTGWAQIAPVPNAPTSVSATAGANLNATVSFTAPTNVPVTSYTVTSSPGNITASGASSPITVTGLTDGTSYTFTVTALGSNGSSTASSASNSIIGSQPFSTTYLVIAGGGAGGNAQSGGGGAGEVAAVEVLMKETEAQVAQAVVEQTILTQLEDLAQEDKEMQEVELLHTDILIELQAAGEHQLQEQMDIIQAEMAEMDYQVQ